MLDDENSGGVRDKFLCFIERFETSGMDAGSSSFILGTGGESVDCAVAEEGVFCRFELLGGVTSYILDSHQ